MFRYAQINQDKVCTSISYLSKEVESDNMILLEDEQEVGLFDTLQDDGTWEKYIPTVVNEPDPIAAIQEENAKLKEQVEATQSAVLALMDILMV